MFNLLKNRVIKNTLSFASPDRIPVVARTITKVEMAKPEILLAAGLLAGVSAAVLLAYNVATNHPKLQDLVDLQKDIQDATDPDDPESVEDAKNETQEIYKEIAKNVVKTYVPPILLFGVSGYCILASYGVIKDRNNNLVAAVTMLQAGIQQYRGRVATTIGAEEEHRIFHNLGEETITDVAVNEDGKTVKTKRKSSYVQETYAPSMYARVFDESVKKMYHPLRVINLHSLTSTQEHFSDLLRVRKVVMLNQVYEHLGFEPTKAGWVVGWVYDPVKDNRIDFGLDNPINQRPENIFFLDFNVDGPVLDAFKD